jgi:hypothetical protein
LARFVTSPEFTDAYRRQHEKPEWGTPLDITLSHARASMRECERWGQPERAAEWRAFIAQLEALK